MSAERRRSFVNPSGREVRGVYRPDDAADLDPARDLGAPGQPPFTRGVHPTMYRGRLWTMRQYAGFGSAEESNRRYRYLLEHGTTGLSVAFDLPTQIGYDSDDPLAAGEVGKVGVAIDSLEDMETLFEGIPLDKVSTSMTINAPAAILLAMYVAVAKRQGVAPAAVSGTIQNDVLKEYIARGTYIFPPGPSLRLVADTFAWCAEHAPRWNPISVSGYHIREAGSTAAQELAFTLANGMAYVQAARERGLDVDAFAPRISFFFNAHNDLFEEVAKFRAARRMWYRIMRETFGAKDPDSWKLRFHTQTAGSMLTAQQPMNNVVRVTVQALAAVLGGTQSLHTNSLDEALGLPTEKAARVALRTQQVLAHESGVANTVDPFAGSWYVERLTADLEAEALAYFARIDAAGGMLGAIERGFPQKEIADAAWRWQRRVETGDDVVVGVNAFREGDEPTEIARVEATTEARQVERVRALRARRDAARWERALADLARAARTDENLMPPILAAVEAYATVGEICGVLRKAWGEYEPPSGF